MSRSCVLHEDVFYEFFRPYRHPKASHDIWGGHGLETFGRDFELVCHHDPSYVWTVVDGSDVDSQWIVPGVHFVNRVCYLITEVPHDSIDVEFRVRNRHTLTPLGLRRQMSKLEKIRVELRA